MSLLVWKHFTCGAGLLFYFHEWVAMVNGWHHSDALQKPLNTRFYSAIERMVPFIILTYTSTWTQSQLMYYIQQRYRQTNGQTGGQSIISMHKQMDSHIGNIWKRTNQYIYLSRSHILIIGRYIPELKSISLQHIIELVPVKAKSYICFQQSSAAIQVTTQRPPSSLLLVHDLDMGLVAAQGS